MNEPDFTQLRRLIDEAITYNDVMNALELSALGLNVAEKKELIGEMMYFQAQIEIIKEDFQGAIRYLDLALEHNPSDGAAYNDRALCMIELGSLEGVIDYFDKGIAAEPDYATVYHNKGWFLNKLGKHEEALLLFHKTLELEPGRAVTYENMADVYLSLNQKEKALDAYKKALKFIKPEYSHIKLQIEDIIKILEHEQ
jgi:tetratricopeptide (TPR) repeat protein